MREDFLEAKARMYEAMEEQGKAKIVARLKRAEALHRTYLQLQIMRRKEGSIGGVSTLRVPSDPTADPKTCSADPTNWTTVRSPNEIEQLLIARNKTHFGQAEGTPFTTEPLKSHIQYDGNGNAADLILEGTYDSSLLDNATQLFIKHLEKRTDHILPTEITREQFIGKLKHWSETTSTSPSGIHLGHYQALRRYHGLPPDDPRKGAVKRGQQFLIDAHLILLNYALKFGYHYDRWTQVVNVMLLKDPGNPRIHRLRVIHLYEADYNLLLAVKWREAMHYAEDNNLLNDGLYGSRAGRSAHEPVFLEILQNEIYMCSMKSGINFDLDATSCYDRILAAIASMSSRRMGMARHVVLVNASTLQEAKFRLKTSLGISDQWYQHCHAFPIHGTGQGSGNSPQIWCFVCSVLFDAFEEATNGATFTSHNGQLSLTIHMVGFVDDCTQRANDFHAEIQPTATALCNRMRHDAQKWNDLLWTSGGALELPKCSFHLIQSEWRPNGKPFLKGGTFAPPIILRHGPVPSQIPQQSNYHSHKTLGCYVNLANNMTKQKKVLQNKCDAEADILSTNVLSRSDTQLFYVSMHLPAMTYVFPVTCLTEGECSTIQHRFMQALVSQSGYNRHMQLALRYGPLAYGGAGFRRLYVEQGLAQVLMALKHLRSPDGQPGRMLKIALSWVQAYVGTSQFLWSDPSSPLPPYPAPWIASVRSFLHRIDGAIALPATNDIVPTPLRTNDEFIMDMVMQRNYSNEIMERVNSCRRYLQAITLSDITDATGARLLPGVGTGTLPSTHNEIRGGFFNQQKPFSPAWLSWRRFLLTFSTPSGRLYRPLRHWTAPYELCRRRPEHVHDPATDILYKHAAGDLYYPLHRLPLSPTYAVPSPLPAGTAAVGYPLYAVDLGRYIRPIINYTICPETVPPPQTATFNEFVRTLPQWEQDLLAHVELLDTPDAIITQLNEGPFSAGSDGSVVCKSGSFGIVVASHTKRRVLRGSGPAPGLNPQSFRAESYGALALYRCLFRLSDYTNTPLTSPFEHFIDSQSVIKRLNKARNQHYHIPNSTLSPDWDVVKIAATTLSHLQVPVSIVWVRGHQDQDRHRLSLPFSAWLNCKADDQAGAYQVNHGMERPSAPLLPSTQAQFLISSASIHSYYKTRIREAATLPPMPKHYEKAFNWLPTTAATIDWPTYKQIIRPFPNRQNTLVKHLHLIAPMGDIANRHSTHYDAACPSCPANPETNDHAIQCPATSRSRWRTSTVQSLQRYMATNLPSDPVLSDLVRDGLQRWHSHLPPPDPTTYPAAYQILIQSQNSIGWSHLYRARWSTSWQERHRAYADRIGLNKKQSDGPAWVRQIGRHLLECWFKLWDLRNEERHGRDVKEKKASRHAFLQSQLEELYSYRPMTMPTDRAMFYDTFEAHITQQTDLNRLEEWIAVWRPAILGSVQQVKAMQALDDG